LKVKALSLFSGGLDSLLAAKVVLEQGIEILAVKKKCWQITKIFIRRLKG